MVAEKEMLTNLMEVMKRDDFLHSKEDRYYRFVCNYETEISPIYVKSNISDLYMNVLCGYLIVRYNDVIRRYYNTVEAYTFMPDELGTLLSEFYQAQVFEFPSDVGNGNLPIIHNNISEDMTIWVEYGEVIDVIKNLQFLDREGLEEELTRRVEVILQMGEES